MTKQKVVARASQQGQTKVIAPPMKQRFVTVIQNSELPPHFLQPPGSPSGKSLNLVSTGRFQQPQQCMFLYTHFSQVSFPQRVWEAKQAKNDYSKTSLNVVNRLSTSSKMTDNKAIVPAG